MTWRIIYKTPYTKQVLNAGLTLETAHKILRNIAAIHQVPEPMRPTNLIIHDSDGMEMEWEIQNEKKPLKRKLEEAGLI